jgi:predicted transcriptional regulator
LPESLEERILSLLQETESCTISQSDLGKALNLTSREIMRSLIKLEKRGVVARVQSKDGGRISYSVKLLKKRPKIDLNDVVWCACLTCNDLEKCGMGQPVSPESCEKLTISIKNEQNRLSIVGEEKRDAQ